MKLARTVWLLRSLVCWCPIEVAASYLTGSASVLVSLSTAPLGIRNFNRMGRQRTPLCKAGALGRRNGKTSKLITTTTTTYVFRFWRSSAGRMPADKENSLRHPTSGWPLRAIHPRRQAFLPSFDGRFRWRRCFSSCQQWTASFSALPSFEQQLPFLERVYSYCWCWFRKSQWRKKTLINTHTHSHLCTHTTYCVGIFFHTRYFARCFLCFIVPSKLRVFVKVNNTQPFAWSISFWFRCQMVACTTMHGAFWREKHIKL